jgi:hypothetical protein
MEEDMMRSRLEEVVDPIPGMEINLGEGWLFTVEEVIDHSVDFTLTLRPMFLELDSKPLDWKRVRAAPTDQKPVGKSLVGRMNRPWTEGEIRSLLSRVGGRLKGSGRWVLESLVELRPKHDGKGWICFAGDESSCLENVHLKQFFFPAIYPAPTGTWACAMADSASSWGRDTRLCLRWI